MPQFSYSIAFSVEEVQVFCPIDIVNCFGTKGAFNVKGMVSFLCLYFGTMPKGLSNSDKWVLRISMAAGKEIAAVTKCWLQTNSLFYRQCQLSTHLGIAATTERTE